MTSGVEIYAVGCALIAAMWGVSTWVIATEIGGNAGRIWRLFAANFHPLGRSTCNVWRAFAATFRQPTPIPRESTKTPTTKGAATRLETTEAHGGCHALALAGSEVERG